MRVVHLLNSFLTFLWWCHDVDSRQEGRGGSYNLPAPGCSPQNQAALSSSVQPFLSCFLWLSPILRLLASALLPNHSMPSHSPQAHYTPAYLQPQPSSPADGNGLLAPAFPPAYGLSSFTTPLSDSYYLLHTTTFKVCSAPLTH